MWALGNRTAYAAERTWVRDRDGNHLWNFGAGKRTHRASLGTVVVEPDDRRVILVWQTGLPVGPRDLDYLDATVISEKAA